MAQSGGIRGRQVPRTRGAVPTSDWHRATAGSDHGLLKVATAHALAAGAKRQTYVFIVASPRPQVGKTFIARLVTDFLRLEHDAPVAFDLNPSGDALTDYLPRLTVDADIGTIRGQMALFDNLIVNDDVAKIVDVGSASFEPFFAIMEEISFMREAKRRAIEPIILYVADAHPLAVRAYADLRHRFDGVIVIPVFNEAILKGRRLREQFPFSRAAEVPLQIPALAPMLRAQIDKPPYSFVDAHDRLPMAIPVGLAVELRSWTRRAFLEFRELELRLLLEQLRASLPGVKL
jgi:hypothetical protein